MENTIDFLGVQKSSIVSLISSAMNAFDGMEHEGLW